MFVTLQFTTRAQAGARAALNEEAMPLDAEQLEQLLAACTCKLCEATEAELQADMSSSCYAYQVCMEVYTTGGLVKLFGPPIATTTEWPLVRWEGAGGRSMLPVQQATPAAEGPAAIVRGETTTEAAATGPPMAMRGVFQVGFCHACVWSSQVPHVASCANSSVIDTQCVRSGQ